MKNASDSHISRKRLETIQMWNEKARELSNSETPGTQLWGLQCGQCDDIDYLLGLIHDKVEGSAS